MTAILLALVIGQLPRPGVPTARPGSAAASHSRRSWLDPRPDPGGDQVAPVIYDYAIKQEHPKSRNNTLSLSFASYF